LVVIITRSGVVYFFFFDDTSTTEIYTLSLHDALPISRSARLAASTPRYCASSKIEIPLISELAKNSLPAVVPTIARRCSPNMKRSEEHTSELQSLAYLVCRLLLEKKKNTSPRILSPRI